MMIYPENLSPNASEIFEINGQSIIIPKCKVDFMKWDGTPLCYTFGGKPIVNYKGNPMFAEMAILNSFRDSGWDARWVETYGKPRLSPIYLSEWIDKDYKSQVHAPIDHKMVNMLLQLIARENDNRFGGCWDVVAWKDDNIIFAESKRSKKDAIQSTQSKWLAAALEVGFTTDNFLMVEWRLI
ncbi:MAG: hypothetical protein LBE37_16515 [Sphingobacterium sp.]|jgi:hypothetical protein|nr:hypothetical protein [Sphingobacterium sp.]